MPVKMLDASSPRDQVELPAPTAWPLTLAFGVSLLAAGLVTNLIISLLGAILMLGGAVGWFRRVLPEERIIVVTVEPQPEIEARPATTHPCVAERAHRARVPVEVYPISAGVKGGIAGGIVMAVLAIFYGLVSKHSVWYPINLLAACVYHPDRAATEPLTAFDGGALIVAIIIHGLVSLLVGALYGALLPIVPRRPVAFGGLVAPVVWTIFLYPIIGIINPVLAARISWAWFTASQVGFGIVAGLVVSRSGRIPTPQLPHVAERLGRSPRSQS